MIACLLWMDFLHILVQYNIFDWLCRSNQECPTGLGKTLQNHRRHCTRSSLPSWRLSTSYYSSGSQSKQYPIRFWNESKNFRFWYGKIVWTWSNQRQYQQNCGDLVSIKLFFLDNLVSYIGILYVYVVPKDTTWKANKYCWK